MVNSSYGCLVIKGRIIVASTAWWDLKPTECFLISLYNLIVSDATCRDTPIYLPNKNPHVKIIYLISSIKKEFFKTNYCIVFLKQPLRLLSYNLSSNSIVLSFICSEKPSVDFIEPIVIIKKIS